MKEARSGKKLPLESLFFFRSQSDYSTEQGNRQLVALSTWRNLLAWASGECHRLSRRETAVSSALTDGVSVMRECSRCLCMINPLRISRGRPSERSMQQPLTFAVLIHSVNKLRSFISSLWERKGERVGRKEERVLLPMYLTSRKSGRKTIARLYVIPPQANSRLIRGFN